MVSETMTEHDRDPAFVAGHDCVIRATCAESDWPAIDKAICDAAAGAIEEWAQDAQDNGEKPYAGAYRFDAGETVRAPDPDREHSVGVDVIDENGDVQDGGYIHIRGWMDPGAE